MPSVTINALTIAAEEETALAILHLRDQLAASRCWQALVANPRSIWATVKAAADASRTSEEATAQHAAGLAVIAFDRLAEEGFGQIPGQEIPQAFIRPIEGEDMEEAGPACWDISNVFSLYLEFPQPDAYLVDPRLSSIDFWNKCDRIRRELRANSGEAGYLDLTHISRVNSGTLDCSDVNGRQLRFAVFQVTYRSQVG